MVLEIFYGPVNTFCLGNACNNSSRNSQVAIYSIKVLVGSLKGSCHCIWYLEGYALSIQYTIDIVKSSCAAYHFDIYHQYCDNVEVPLLDSY